MDRLDRIKELVEKKTKEQEILAQVGLKYSPCISRT